MNNPTRVRNYRKNSSRYCILELSILILLILTPGIVVCAQDNDDSWSSKASLQIAREDITANTLNDKIYTFGLAIGEDSYFSTVEEYDPKQDLWNTKAPMPTARGYLAATTINQKIYTLGGGVVLRTILPLSKNMPPQPIPGAVGLICQLPDLVWPP